MEEINDRDLELMFSFVFGWQGYFHDEMRFLLTRFLEKENLTAKEVVDMMVGEYEYLRIKALNFENSCHLTDRQKLLLEKLRTSIYLHTF